MYSSITTQIYGDIERERGREMNMFIFDFWMKHIHITHHVYLYVYIYTHSPMAICKPLVQNSKPRASVCCSISIRVLPIHLAKKTQPWPTYSLQIAFKFANKRLGMVGHDCVKPATTIWFKWIAAASFLPRESEPAITNFWTANETKLRTKHRIRSHIFP